MAVDTRNKRLSAIHGSLPWRGMLPTPDGTVVLADRQTLALHYSGILAGEPPGGGTPGTPGDYALSGMSGLSAGGDLGQAGGY